MRKLLFALLLLVACSDPAVEVPKLIEQLKDKDSHVRNTAAMNLASYGDDAKEAVPALARTLRDPNLGVRSSAAFALRKIGTPAATKALDNYRK